MTLHYHPRERYYGTQVTDKRLFDVARGSPLIPLLQRRLAGRDFLSLHSVAAAAQPFIVALLAELAARPVLVVSDGTKTQEAFLADLQTFVPTALPFPAWETLPHEDILPNEQTIADRLRVLTRFAQEQADPTPPLVVAPVQALLQRTLAPALFRRERLSLTVGQALERDALVAMLSERGYAPQVQVGEPGDMALRGGLVDFFPLDASAPVRVEFNGDQLESLRTFDPVTQQSREHLPRFECTAAGEIGLLRKSPDQSASLAAFLPADTLLVQVEPDTLAPAAAAYAQRVPANDPFFVPWTHWEQAAFPRVHLAETPAPAETPATPDLQVTSLEALRPPATRLADPEIAELSRRQFFDQLLRWAAAGHSLFAFCDTTGEKERFEIGRAHV